MLPRTEHDWDLFDRIYANPVFRAAYGFGRGEGSWECGSCFKRFHYHDLDDNGNCPSCRWGVVKRG